MEERGRDLTFGLAKGPALFISHPISLLSES